MYAVRACLEAIYYAYGHTVSPDQPCKSIYQTVLQRPLQANTIKVPKLMFTVLNGGKALNSKVRFSKFYLILDVNVSDQDIDASEVYFKASTAIKKAISGHKAGETGFKANPSGQYFNALDTINDSFKLLEDAIAAVGVNTNERKYLSIGINADSQSAYMAEAEKYDIEGPKNLFDCTMLADYFVKMVNDHPLLTYIEDPFAEGDVLGYQKILRRFKDSQVKIGVQQWFGSDLERLQEFTQMVQVESDDEEEEEEEKQEDEEEERLRKEEEERKAAEEAAAQAAAAEDKKKGGKGKK